MNFRRTNILASQKLLSPPEMIEAEKMLRPMARDGHVEAMVVLLLLRTGARIREILNLGPNDLIGHGAAGAVFIKAVKHGTDREFPLKALDFKLLETFARPRREIGSERIFPVTYNRVRNFWMKVRPAPKKLHSIRHGSAVRWYDKTKDIRLVKTGLGHRSINNTMIYLEHVEAREHIAKIRAAMEKVTL